MLRVLESLCYVNVSSQRFKTSGCVFGLSTLMSPSYCSVTDPGCGPSVCLVTSPRWPARSGPGATLLLSTQGRTGRAALIRATNFPSPTCLPPARISFTGQHDRILRARWLSEDIPGGGWIGHLIRNETWVSPQVRNNMIRSTLLLLALSLASVRAQTSPIFGQCGGTNWPGPFSA